MKYIVRCIVVVTPFEEQVDTRKEREGFIYTCIFEAEFSGHSVPRKGEMFPLNWYGDESNHEVLFVSHRSMPKNVRKPVVHLGKHWLVERKEGESLGVWSDRVQSEAETRELISPFLSAYGFTYVSADSYPNLPWREIVDIGDKPPVTLEEIHKYYDGK